MKRLKQIVSGGQTGADRAALDFAIGNNIPYGGWCPRDGWAEDFPRAPGLLNKYPNLHETPSDDSEQRTRWNVRDSSLTLILLKSDEFPRSEGTLSTLMVSNALGRPCQIVNLSADGAIDATKKWLKETLADGIVNIAGPRESECPGIYLVAKKFLELVFGQ